MKVGGWFRGAVVVFLGMGALGARVVEVDGPAALDAALRDVREGDVIRIAPGNYPGGRHTEGKFRLTVEASDPADPPRFHGGNTGWHFTRCVGLTLRNLRFVGARRNGLNLDEGGPGLPLAGGITLEGVTVEDVGPDGNHDGIKGSGLEGARFRNCVVRGWGGQGIDLVGCHRSRITGCRLEGKVGSPGTAGVQIKGGSSEIVVEGCRFVSAGERPLNVGGSTGREYFRPPGAGWEAKDIVVRDNVIEGGACAAAFVGVDGARFEGNTVLFPGRWLFRVLQETTGPEFAPCRNVVVRENRVVFRRRDLREDVNVGPGTAPETFRWEGNAWFAEDRPEASRPGLPGEETGGSYGTDPRKGKG
jgi:hypothetical protein